MNVLKKFATNEGRQFIIREGRKIEVEILPCEAQPSKSRRREPFTLVPDVWKQRLAKVKYISTYRVALHILGRNFETHGKPFTLSNVALTLEGVSRWQKWRALLELEEVGLIVIERRKRKTPRITTLFTGRKPAKS